MLKKRIPTIIGIFLLIIGALVGVLFINQGTGFLPRASPEYIPQKISLTNITDKSFTVSWITQEPTVGFVKYGLKDNNLSTTVVDERDQLTGDSGEYRTHYVSILGLEPQTTYYFKLGSHGNRLYDDNGQALKVTTGVTLSNPPAADTSYGNVFTPAQTPAEGAIIYLSFPDSVNATPLSSLVKQNGSWAISLSTARSQDLAKFATYDLHNTTLTLLARSNLNDDATALTSTDLDQPVPNIELGKQQDFRTVTTPNSPTESSLTTPTPPPASKFSLAPLTVTDQADDSTLVIDTLPKNNLTVKSTQPKIQGKAPPGTALIITIHSSSLYTDTVNSDETGRWTWSPPGYLSVGEHTLSIAYTDQKGILHSLSRTFIVQAASAESTSLSYSATPSAQVTQPPLPTQIPTKPPSPQPSITPKVIPTKVPTLIATPTHMITPVVTPSVLPTAGSNLPTLTLIFIGSLFCLVGVVLAMSPRL